MRARASARTSPSSASCADISGVFVDAAGEPVDGRATDRMIGIDAAQMHAIPEVIAIVYGAAKAPAARAAVRGRPGQRASSPTRRSPGRCSATHEPDAACSGHPVTRQEC